jgi:hypothetical protein
MSFLKFWFIDYINLKIRYTELLTKCERQRKQISMLEQSRNDIRKHRLTHAEKEAMNSDTYRYLIEHENELD